MIIPVRVFGALPTQHRLGDPEGIPVQYKGNGDTNLFNCPDCLWTVRVTQSIQKTPQITQGAYTNSTHKGQGQHSNPQSGICKAPATDHFDKIIFKLQNSSGELELLLHLSFLKLFFYSLAQLSIWWERQTMHFLLWQSTPAWGLRSVPRLRGSNPPAAWSLTPRLVSKKPPWPCRSIFIRSPNLKWVPSIWRWTSLLNS